MYGPARRACPQYYLQIKNRMTSDHAAFIYVLQCSLFQLERFDKLSGEVTVTEIFVTHEL